MSCHLRVALALLVWLFSFSCHGTSLWFSGERTLYRSDTSRIVQTIAIDHIGSLAADTSGGVWALTEKGLTRFDLNGFVQFDIDVKTLGLKADTLAAADPFDGSLWLAGEKQLLHLGPKGARLSETTLPDKARGLTVNLDQTLAILGQKRLWHYSAQGALLNEIDLRGVATEEPKSLALDPLGGLLWLGGEKQLTQWDAAQPSAPRAMLTLPKALRAMALDPRTGALWLITEDALLIYSRAGTLAKSQDLKALNLKEPRTLGYDTTTSDVWIGHQQGVSRFTAQGDLALTLPAGDKIQAIATAPFNILPTLTLLAPQPNLLTNDPRPAYRLQYDAHCLDSPCGLQPSYTTAYRLDATLNGQPTGSQFSFDPQTGQASFIPGSSLPQGVNAFSAQVTDQFGHLSNRIDNRITIDSIAPQFFDITPPEGSVFNQPGITIAGKTDDPQASVTLDGVGQASGQSFSFPAVLQPGLNAFRLSAADPAGNSNSANLKYTYQALTLEIATPANGAAINDDSVLVSGTFSANGMVGFTVNGSVAAVAGNRFQAVVPLAAGTNTITVTATTLDGIKSSKKVVVTAVASPVKVTVSPNPGLAGLPVVFTLAAANPITRIEVDYNGDGAVDQTTTDSATKLQFTYTAAGTYQAKFKITDNQSQVLQKDVTVVVQDPDQIDQMLKAAWVGFTGALARRNKAEAMGYLSAEGQAKYGPALDALMPNMAQIVASYSTPLRGELSASYAEYGIFREHGGQKRLHLIYFLRDADGVWRIVEM